MKRIIYTNEYGGVTVLIPTGELSIEEVALKDVPQGTHYEIVDVAEIPNDRFFRGAWVMGDCCIDVDLDKAKDIGHDMRRAQREAEFAPFDAIIMKQIPGLDASEAEASRQEIRFKYALIQDAINVAETTDEIKSALEA
jgi:hypothetical protein